MQEQFVYSITNANGIHLIRRKGNGIMTQSFKIDYRNSNGTVCVFL